MLSLSNRMDTSLSTKASKMYKHFYTFKIECKRLLSNCFLYRKQPALSAYKLDIILLSKRSSAFEMICE